ncbi:hypothetical protein [Bradyrhizobium genomosp. III]|uniref:hypothetical protein n=1 Tax=Bradyrhizobium genomosp. III TaxID=2683271 RepID=UPI00057780D0|nr:hypothetical protein [Bradyrhizobium sp. CCBAU 15635]
MYWPASEDAQYWSSLITIVGLPLTVLALGATVRQLWLSQRTGSVAAVTALHDSLRECWLDYFKAPPADRGIPFGDLCNTLELACAVTFDKVLYGRSGELLNSYVLSNLKLIERNDDLRNELLNLLEDHTTFLYIRRFLKKNRKRLQRLNV